MLEPEVAGLSRLSRLQRQVDDLAGRITRFIGRNADDAQFESSNDNEPLLVQADNPAGTTLQVHYCLRPIANSCVFYISNLTTKEQPNLK